MKKLLVLILLLIATNSYAQLPLQADRITTGLITTTTCDQDGNGTGCLTISTQGTATFVANVLGTLSGSYVFEARNGTRDKNGNSVPWTLFKVITSSSSQPSSTISSNGIYFASSSGYSQVRIRALFISNPGVGQGNIILEASSGQFNPETVPQTSGVGSVSSGSNFSGLSTLLDCTGFPNILVTATSDGLATVELFHNSYSGITVSLTGPKTINVNSSFIFTEIMPVNNLILTSITTGVSLTMGIQCGR